MTKPKESAEEIVNLIISNTASQYSEEWKPDIVYTKEELIEIVKSFQDQCAREAIKEERERVVMEFKKLFNIHEPL